MREVSGHISVTTVITVLRACAAAHSGGGPALIERAARSKLAGHPPL